MSKLTKIAKFWKETQEQTAKFGRHYVTNPADAPKGARIKKGKRGGYYYEDSGKSQQKPSREDLRKGFERDVIKKHKELLERKERAMKYDWGTNEAKEKAIKEINNLIKEQEEYMKKNKIKPSSESKGNPNSYQKNEHLSLIDDLFDDGMDANEIAEEVNEQYGTNYSSSDIKEMVRELSKGAEPTQDKPKEKPEMPRKKSVGEEAQEKGEKAGDKSSKTNDTLWSEAVSKSAVNDTEGIIKNFFKIAKEKGVKEEDARQYAYDHVEALIGYLESKGKNKDASYMYDILRRIK